MRLIEEVFGQSPFGPLLEHTKRAEGCVALLRPLLEAAAREDYGEVHRLQDEVSRLEYEADQIKNRVRENLPGRIFLPVDRGDIDRFLHSQDGIADAAEELADTLRVRHTKIHPDLVEPLLAFVDQVVCLAGTQIGAAKELMNLAETSFGGAEARAVLKMIADRNEEEWKADRMRRHLAACIYGMEERLDPISILFYERILRALGKLASAAENTGDALRAMIVKE